MLIKIFATSDVHGYISPYSYANHSLLEQGLCRLSQFIKDNRDENTILIDNGDSLEGSSSSYYHHLFEEETMNSMAKALNYLDYDFVNIGNHDFNYGTKVLNRYLKDLNAKCVTGNIIDESNNLNYHYEIKDIKGFKIAIIGAVTIAIDRWEKKQNIVGLSFENVSDYFKRVIKEIKENHQVDLIVGVYHGGFERDLETGKLTEKDTLENQGYDVCAKNLDLDILITGHQHRSLTGKCFNTYVSQTACNAQELAYYSIDTETKEIKCELVKAQYDIDDNLYALIKDEEEKVDKWLDTPLGCLKEGDLLVEDEFEARLHKHPVVSFLNQVQLDYSKADLSSVALFNGVKGFNHDITMRDLTSTYVYPNTLSTVKIDGYNLKLFLEKCAEFFDVKDDKIIVNREFEHPKPQHYNYDMVDGVEYTIKCSNPKGSRIVELKYQGKDVKDEDIFTMVVSNYRHTGGGNFDMMNNLETVVADTKDVVEVISDYIIKNTPVVVKHCDNIKVVK